MQRKWTVWLTSLACGVPILGGFLAYSKFLVEGPLKIQVAALEQDKKGLQKENNILQKELSECRTKIDEALKNTHNQGAKVSESNVNSNVTSNEQEKVLKIEDNTISKERWKKKLDIDLGSYYDMFQLRVESIERLDNDIVVGISSRNISQSINKIYLVKSFAKNTKLLNEKTGKEYIVKKIIGIKEKSVKINPNEILFTYFTFSYPDNSKSVTLITRIQCGPGVKGFKIPISVPINIPNNS